MTVPQAGGYTDANDLLRQVLEAIADHTGADESEVGPLEHDVDLEALTAFLNSNPHSTATFQSDGALVQVSQTAVVASAPEGTVCEMGDD